MSKYYLVTGGGFMVIGPDQKILEKNLNIHVNISAQFPEAAKNKAFSRLKTRLTKKYGKDIIIRQKKDIRVVTCEEPESIQKELFK